MNKLSAIRRVRLLAKYEQARLEKTASSALFRHALAKAKKLLPGFKYVKTQRAGGSGKVGNLQKQVAEHLHGPAYTNKAGGSRVDDASIMGQIFMPTGVKKRRIDITGLTGPKGSPITPFGSEAVPRLRRPLGRFGKTLPSRSTPDWRHAADSPSWRGPQRVEADQLVGHPWGRSARWSKAGELFGSSNKGVAAAAESRMKQQLSGRHWLRYGPEDAAKGDMFLPSRSAFPSNPREVASPSSLTEGIRHSQPAKNLFFRGTNTATPRAARSAVGQEGVFVTRHPSTAVDYAFHGAQLGGKSSHGMRAPGHISVMRPAKGVKRRGEGPHFGPRDTKQYMDARPRFAEAQAAKHNPQIHNDAVINSPFYEDIWNIGKKVNPAKMNVGSYNLVPALRGVKPGWAVQRVGGPRADKLFKRGPAQTVVEQGRRVPLAEGHNLAKPTFDWQRPATPGW